jgi:hypothetical protein
MFSPLRRRLAECVLDGWLRQFMGDGASLQRRTLRAARGEFRAMRKRLLLGPAVLMMAPSALLAALDSGQCSVIDMQSREAVCGTVSSTALYNSARSNPGSASAPIDVWGTCRYIDNISPDTPVFVPFKTAEEWQAFITSYPSSILAPAHCARPMNDTIPPDARCLTPSPATQIVSLPYARTGATRSDSVQFSCVNDGKDCINGLGATWVETASATYLGLDSDTNNPSWSRTSLVYSGSPPASCVRGQCGPSNGMTLSAPPVDGLCSMGAASSVSGSGPWSWTCAGLYNGLSASCTAAALAINGQCGPANGLAVSSFDGTGLCSVGTSSGVSGSGPWSWDCVGQYGGAVAHCSSPLQAVEPKFIAEWSFHDADYIYVGSQIVYQSNYSADQARSGALPRQMFIPSGDNMTVTASFQNSANCQGYNNAQPPFNGYVQTGTATARIKYKGTSPLIMQIAWSGCGETQNGYLNPAGGLTFEHMGLSVYEVDDGGNHLNGPLSTAQAISTGGHEDNTCGMSPVYSLAPPSVLDAVTVSNMACPVKFQDYGISYDLMTIEPGKQYELKIDTSTIDPFYHVNAWYQFHLSFKH